jgi:hypothetical protein
VVSLEFNGLGAGEIKRRPEVEPLLITRDNRAGVMRRVLNRLTEGVNRGPALCPCTFRQKVHLMIILQNGLEFRKLTPSS